MQKQILPKEKLPRITAKRLGEKFPCYNIDKSFRDPEWEGDAIDCFNYLPVSTEDAFWCILSEEFLPKEVLSKFARYCYRIFSPDDHICLSGKDACDDEPDVFTEALEKEREKIFAVNAFLAANAESARKDMSRFLHIDEAKRNSTNAWMKYAKSKMLYLSTSPSVSGAASGAFFYMAKHYPEQIEPAKEKMIEFLQPYIPQLEPTRLERIKNWFIETTEKGKRE